jgi:hypothetical protein
MLSSNVETEANNGLSESVQYVNLICAVNRWHHPKRDKKSNTQENQDPHFKRDVVNTNDKTRAHCSSFENPPSQSLTNSHFQTEAPHIYVMGIDQIPMPDLCVHKGSRAHNPYQNVIK